MVMNSVNPHKMMQSTIQKLKTDFPDVTPRFERKFRLNNLIKKTLKYRLFSMGFMENFPERKVNSCYFDNDNLTLFHESEEGVMPRKKIRIRWYDKVMSFTKEIKTSSIEGRFKSLKKNPKLKHLDDVLNSQYFDSSYGILKPSLLVSYERQYFSFKLLRITFDRNISYRYLKYSSEVIRKENETVMEVKTPIDCSDDYIKSIITQPTERFSKYSRGLLCFERF